MDLCVMIEGQEGVGWDQWRALAAGCEANGIPALFRSDHYLSLGEGADERQVLDAWGTTCALAAITSTVRLGTLVSPATFRHPSVLAKLAVTADHVSGGRIEVGLGAGWNELEHAAFGFPFADLGTRMSVFAEQLQIVRGLTDPAPFELAGEHYRVGPVQALPKPVQTPACRSSSAAARRHAAQRSPRASPTSTTRRSRRPRRSPRGAPRWRGRGARRGATPTACASR